MSPGTAATWGPETGERCTRHTTSRSSSRCSRARPTTPDAPVSRTVRRGAPGARPTMRGPVSLTTDMASPDQDVGWHVLPAERLVCLSRATRARVDTQRHASESWRSYLPDPAATAADGQGGVDGDDDGAPDRYGNKRAEEAGAEESPADTGERHQLERHRRERDQHRGVVLGDEERQRVQDAAEERAEAGDRAARVRAAAAGQVAGVG